MARLVMLLTGRQTRQLVASFCGAAWETWVIHADELRPGDQGKGGREAREAIPYQTA